MRKEKPGCILNRNLVFVVSKMNGKEAGYRAKTDGNSKTDEQKSYSRLWRWDAVCRSIQSPVLLDPFGIKKTNNL